MTHSVCRDIVGTSIIPTFDGIPMSFILQPRQLLLIILASWVNEQQQQVIEYLVEENRVLRRNLGN